MTGMMMERAGMAGMTTQGMTTPGMSSPMTTPSSWMMVPRCTFKFEKCQGGMKVTCIRIGNFGEEPLDHRRLSIWLKPEDLVQLCRIGLEHPDIHFELLYGAAFNERAWWDNHRAYDLGYRPTGRGEAFREHAMAEQAKLKPDSVADFYQGGAFCSMEFSGDASKIIDWT